MRKLATLLIALGLSVACAASVQEPRATLERAANVLGATDVKTLEYTGSGVQYQSGQSQTPGDRWPRFNVPSFTRVMSYETASMQDTVVRTQGENPPRGGGVQPIRGEQRQVLFLSGEHAWNQVGDAAVPAPIALAERQLQLWATPHGFIRAAQARNATVSGRTVSFTVPGHFSARGTLNAEGLVEKIEAMLPSPVVGDMPLEITYADYKPFGAVKFPTRIRQSQGGFPTLELTVTDVKVNGPVAIAAPDAVRQATAPYAVVKSDRAADGVWYVTGGTHHSVVIEMADHIVLVEGPLNDQRALAVMAEARRLVPGKPIRYVIASHHHFDHSGGLRAFAAEGVTLIVHDSAAAYFERALAAPATIDPDHLAKSGRRGRVQKTGSRRTLADATRSVDIHHMSDNAHADSMLIVHLPKEQLLIQADAFTPLAPGAPVPTPPSPFSVNLADNIGRLNLAVAQILPLHGRMVPLSELYRTLGRAG
jgi:glyoxylase-like metal-dependent hydrolase (beta-lactamase superfamily II)